MVSGNYTSLWVYLTGPFVGSVLGCGHLPVPPPEKISVEIDEERLDDEARGQARRALDEDER